jgi:hypothetical protein
VAVCVRPAARDQVLDLICAFHAEHGRLPRWLEWEHAAEDRPCARTIERRWGWRNVMAEAVGVEVDGLELWEGMVDERARRMLSALAEARDELGRWPFAEEWEQSGRKPSRRSFVRYFGSWEEACGATGAAVRIANVPGLSGVSMPEVDRLG